MQWYAIQVTTQHEYKVKRHLERNRLSVGAGIIGDILVPEKDGKSVLPGYVFVQCEEWPQGFLMGAETRCKVLETVPDSEIHKMMCVINEVALEPDRRISVFVAGERVTINAGPFIGCEAVIKKAGSRRCKVLIEGGVILECDNRALEINR